VVAALYRRLMSPTHPAWIAALAALLFTLDDAHSAPVGWVANRCTLLAALGCALTLLAHDRWRREEWRPGAALAPLALLVGLLAKEAAVCTGAYLLAYALFFDHDSWRRRLLSLLPCLFVGVVWALAYRAFECGPVAFDAYTNPSQEPARFALQVLRNGPILLLGQWSLPFAELAGYWSASAFVAHWLWALFSLALLGAALAPLLARDRVARFWALGMMLSVLPTCATVPSNRLLMFVGFGAMGLLAQWLGGLKEGAAWVRTSRAWRCLYAVLKCVLIAIHCVIAPLMLTANAVGGGYTSKWLNAYYDTFPNDAELEDQTTVFVNSMSWYNHLFLIQLRRYNGGALPARSLNLSPCSTATTLTRIDAMTLAVRPQGGYLPPRGQLPGCGQTPPVLSSAYNMQAMDRWVRREDNPMHLGQTIELTAATIEITDLTEDGRPAEATFRFRVPLEDPSLRWFQLTQDGYAAFAPPAIGETVNVPWLMK
jgi:hypothetical protein